jgi:hypothetical protein
MFAEGTQPSEGVGTDRSIQPDESRKSHNLEPEWESASADAGIPFLSVDCIAQGSPCDALGVTKIPTIKLFHSRNESTEYLGPRRAGAILKYLERRSRPLLSEVDDAGLQSFKAVDYSVFVAYLHEEDEAPRRMLQSMAARYRDEFTFGIVTDEAAMKSEDITPPAVRCYKAADETTETFSSFDEPTGFEEWLIEASRLYIGELMPYNHQRLLDVSLSHLHSIITRHLSLTAPPARLANGVHLRPIRRRTRRSPAVSETLRKSLLRLAEHRDRRPPRVPGLTGKDGSHARSIPGRRSPPALEGQGISLPLQPRDHVSGSAALGPGCLAGKGEAVDAAGSYHPV